MNVQVLNIYHDLELDAVDRMIVEQIYKTWEKSDAYFRFYPNDPSLFQAVLEHRPPKSHLHGRVVEALTKAGVEMVNWTAENFVLLHFSY